MFDLLTSEHARNKGQGLIEQEKLQSYFKYLSNDVHDLFSISATEVNTLKINLIYTSGAWPPLHSMKILHTCVTGNVDFLMCNPGVFKSVSNCIYLTITILMFFCFSFGSKVKDAEKITADMNTNAFDGIKFRGCVIEGSMLVSNGVLAKDDGTNIDGEQRIVLCLPVKKVCLTNALVINIYQSVLQASEDRAYGHWTWLSPTRKPLEGIVLEGPLVSLQNDEYAWKLEVARHWKGSPDSSNIAPVIFRWLLVTYSILDPDLAIEEQEIKWAKFERNSIYTRSGIVVYKGESLSSQIITGIAIHEGQFGQKTELKMSYKVFSEIVKRNFKKGRYQSGSYIELMAHHALGEILMVVIKIYTQNLT